MVMTWRSGSVAAPGQIMVWQSGSSGSPGVPMAWDPDLAAAPGARPLDWIEVEIERCQLTYGIAPCQAVLGVTGAHKCFNGVTTCQDLDNYAPATYWLRFSEPVADLPRLQTFTDPGLPWWLPIVSKIRHSPVKPDPGRSIGVRAALSVTLQDVAYHDRGIDKYVDDRPFDPATRSTLWLKLLTRFPFYVGRALRWHRGHIGGAYTTRHYVMERVEGPDSRGRVEITAKDPLKLADGSRAQAPRPSEGVLAEDITETATPTTIDVATPAPSEYDCHQKGWRRVDGIVAGASVSGNACGLLDTSVQGTAYTLAEDLGSPDHWCQCVRLTAADKLYFELAVRVTDADNFYGLRYNSAGGGWELYRVEAGAFTRIAFSATPAAQVGDVMRLEAEGTAIRGYVNGQPVASHATQTAHQSVTRQGLVAAQDVGNPALDDYEAGTIESGVLVPRFFDNFTRGDDSLQGTQAAFIGGEGFSYTATAAISGGVRLTGVTRGLPGGYVQAEPKSHSIGDSVQLGLYYNQERLVDIVEDLLLGYVPGFDPAWIPRAAWDLEHSTWLAGLTLTRLIAEPEGVAALIDEIVGQTLTWSFWWDDSGQVVRYQATRPPDLADPVPVLSDGAHLVAGSVDRVDEPERLVNIVQIVYGQVDPSKSRDDRTNYRKVAIRADVDSLSADQLGQQRIRQVFARWHPATNDSFIAQLTARTLLAGADKAFRIEADLTRRDGEALGTGGFVRLDTSWIIDALGNPLPTRMRVLHVEADGDRIRLKARADAFSSGRTFGRLAPGALSGQLYSASSQDERERYLHLADAAGKMSDGSDGYRLL